MGNMKKLKANDRSSNEDKFETSFFKFTFIDFIIYGVSKFSVRLCLHNLTVSHAWRLV